MHAVIFLGFMTLLARKVQLLAIGYDETFVYPGLAGGMFASFKDLVELAVLAAVGYALWRRLVQKPARLERNREALVILSLIAAIMVTDFLFDGFRFALKAPADPGIAHERSFAFAGDAIARMLSGLSPDQLAAGYHVSYWIQMLTVLELPRDPAGRRALPHRHRAARALLPARRAGQPRAGGGPGSDHGRERRGRHEDRGAHRARSDLEGRARCVHVHRMRAVQGRVPDLSDRQAAVPEKGLRQPQAASAGAARRDHRRRRCRAAGAGRRSHRAGDALGVHDVRLLRGGVPDRARASAALLPDAPASGPDGGRLSTRAQGRVRRLRGPEQSVGAAGRHARRTGQTGSAFPSCKRPKTCGPSTTCSTSARRSRSIRVRRRSRSRSSRSCSTPAYGSGSSARARRRPANACAAPATRCCSSNSRGRWSRRLNGLGVTRIVTCDPHAFNTLKNEYPEFGGHYEVIASHAAHRAPHGRGPHPRRAGPSSASSITSRATSRRHNGEYEAPRAIIAQLTRDAPLEFELRREKAMCCGAGGARMWMEENIGRRINVTRVEQALPQQPRVIATACPYCATMMSDGVEGARTRVGNRDARHRRAGRRRARARSIREWRRGGPARARPGLARDMSLRQGPQHIDENPRHPLRAAVDNGQELCDRRGAQEARPTATSAPRSR